ncbi:hypothetical protein KIL84_001591 [Mauremys mutica]|uniref:Uncharacterized protein n=1 Tax=Mauremys mutica TaxID=74926 RepID=A0A9D4AXZ5_9SAUR|nr:hypothetical protein KIL84_001591 [Mauremys mutica]
MSQVCSEPTLSSLPSPSSGPWPSEGAGTWSIGPPGMTPAHPCPCHMVPSCGRGGYCRLRVAHGQQPLNALGLSLIHLPPSLPVQRGGCRWGSTNPLPWHRTQASGWPFPCSAVTA